MSEPAFKTTQRLLLRDIVTPHIGREAVYWDLPYHNNIGDLLIWQGTADLLRSLRVNVLDNRSFDTCTFPRLRPATTIVLHGGGNFGTLYPWYQAFRREVLRRYPDNPVIIMPQSVHYDDTPDALHTLTLDRRAYNAHPRVTMCARDTVSYDFMRAHFPQANVLLAPDAAFSIDDTRLRPYRDISPTADTIFIRRRDKEITPRADHPSLAALPPRDWYDRPTPARRIADIIDPVWKRLSYTRFAPRWPGTIAKHLVSSYYNSIMLPDALRAGCTLIAPYRRVITTRLHSMILAAMLGREVLYIDNTTGKISAYVNTWLTRATDVAIRPFTAP